MRIIRRFDRSPNGNQLGGELDEPFDPFEAPEDAQVEVQPLLEQPNVKAPS
jgi:hypothetical protein